MELFGNWYGGLEVSDIFWSLRWSKLPGSSFAVSSSALWVARARGRERSVRWMAGRLGLTWERDGVVVFKVETITLDIIVGGLGRED